MGLDTIQFERIRDRNLRGLILSILQKARGKSPTGNVEGETLLVMLEATLSRDTGIQDDKHLLTLLSELQSKGMVECEWKPRRDTEKLSCRHVKAHITNKGTELLNWAIEADPMINDDRSED